MLPGFPSHVDEEENRQTVPCSRDKSVDKHNERQTDYLGKYFKEDDDIWIGDFEFCFFSGGLCYPVLQDSEFAF